MKSLSCIQFLLLMMILLNITRVVAQKPNVQVTFTIATNTPFHSKYKQLSGGDKTLYVQQVLDTLISGLNEYIAFAHFQKEPQTMKLNIELNRKLNTGSDHYLLFTFNPGDGSDIGRYDFKYLDINRLAHLIMKLPEAVDDLAQVWYEHLQGNYDEGLTQTLFPTLYMTIPSGVHYRPNYKVVFPESKSSLRLNTALSKFTVAIAFQDDPGAFIPQNDLVYSEDCKEDLKVGVKQLKGCVTVQLARWEANRNPVGGKIYFKEYKRQVHGTLLSQ